MIEANNSGSNDGGGNSNSHSSPEAKGIADQESQHPSPSEQDSDEISHLNGSLQDKLAPKNVIFRTTNPTCKGLDLARVKKWLIKAESSEDMKQSIMSRAPLKPRAGEIFLYRCRNDNDFDYQCDLYTGFVSKGNNRRANHSVIKKYYKMTSTEGLLLPFEKDIYELRNPPEPSKKVVLIHYRGDETKWTPRPHGLSRRNKMYTRNTGVAKSRIESVLESTKAKPGPAYTLALSAAKTSDPEFAVTEAVAGPRDKKQIANIKFKLDSKLRLFRCDIFSTIEMGKNSTLGSFIIKHVVNPFDVIILAHPCLVKLANVLLDQAGRNKATPQLLTYDTTFELGDTYVSALIMRNTMLEGDPIFPVSFMLHARKTKQVHMEFWWEMSKLLHLQVVQDNVPICTDREDAISAAILNIFPMANLVYCVNHIMRDVDRWIQTSQGKTTDDKIGLKNHMRNIIASTSEEELEEKFKNCQVLWSQSFKNYALSHLKEDIKYHSALYFTSKFPAFQGKTPTNNLSESMNFVIKDHNNWNLLRIDSLVLAFLNLSLRYVRDYSRPYSEYGIGDFVLKEAFKAQRVPYEVPNHIYWDENQFMEFFRAGVYKPNENIEKEGNYLQCKHALAKQVCAQNLVSLDSKSGTFTVTAPYSGVRYLLHRKVGGQLHCSCDSTGFCYHRMAVFYAMSIEIPTDDFTYSLNALKKNTRGYAGRTGKKQPRPGDIILDINEAPDSDLATLCNSSQENKECHVVISKQARNQKGPKAVRNAKSVKITPSVPSPHSQKITGMASDSFKDSADENAAFVKTDDLICGKPSGNPPKDYERKLRETGPNSSEFVQGFLDENATSEKIDELKTHHYDSPYNFPTGKDNVLFGQEQDDSQSDIERSLLTSKANDFAIENTAKELPAHLFKSHKFACLRPGQWLTDDIVDNMICALIKIHDREDSVAFVNTHECNNLLMHKYDRILASAARAQALNSDLVLFSFNTAKHWILAVVVWKCKEVILLNSIPGIPGDDRPIFRAVLTFVAASSFIAEVKFNWEEWSFIRDPDTPRQKNGYDCGLYVCLFVYAIVRREKYLPLEVTDDSGLGRRWILKCLLSFDMPIRLREHQKLKRIPPSSKLILQPYLKDYENMTCQPKTAARNFVITSQLRCAVGSEYECNSLICLKPESQTRQLLFCVQCREWYHDVCQEKDIVKEDYYLCNDCSTFKHVIRSKINVNQ